MGYVPDGWLGILVGTRLFFDLTGEDRLETSLPRLVRELGDRGRVRCGENNIVAVQPTISHMVSSGKATI